MISKEMKYNLHCGDVRGGDVLPPHIFLSVSLDSINNFQFRFLSLLLLLLILLNHGCGLWSSCLGPFTLSPF